MPGSLRSPIVVLLQNPEDRTMYAEFLGHHNVEALCPVDTVEGLALAARADIVVTELMVPTVADGVAFIQRLRSEPRTKRVPILVVTSWAWQTERLLAQDAGCDLFLTKPCLPDELLREIRDLLATRKLRSVRGRATKTRESSRPKRRSS